MKTEVLELNWTVIWRRLLKEMKTLRGTIIDGGPNEGNTDSRIDYNPALIRDSIMALGVREQSSRSTSWPRKKAAKYLRWQPQCARMYFKAEDDD